MKEVIAQEFELSPKFADHVFTYGEEFTDSLPVLANELAEGVSTLPRDTELSASIDAKVQACVAEMSVSAAELLDSVLLCVCGWTIPTLMKFASEKSLPLVDILVREITSDDEDPFKQTGRVINDWVVASLGDRTAVDHFFVLSCGQRITDVLINIQKEVLVKMN